MNKFELDLPENGFVYPCNICKHRNDDVKTCNGCDGLVGPFPVEKSELKALMEKKE